MSLQINLAAALGAIWTLDQAPAGSTPRVNLTQYDVRQVFDGTTTPAVDVVPIDVSRTLAGASETEDLASAKKAYDTAETEDLATATVKLVFGLLKAGSANSGDLTITPGATNGYNLFGTASDRITLKPGHFHLWGQLAGAADLPTTSGTAKTIDVAGTIGDTLTGLLIFTDP